MLARKSGIDFIMRQIRPTNLNQTLKYNNLSTKVGLDDISRQLKNSKVFMRVDFNVPLKDGKVKDPTRIKSTIPSIKKVLSENPKSLVLGSHMGRPEGNVNAKFSMAQTVPALEEHLGQKVRFLKDCVGQEVIDTVKQANNGEVFLLENLRFHPEEEGKYVDAQGKKQKADKKAIESFRAQLNQLGDLYVNDAFGTAHRAHSSMVGSNHKIRAAGYLLKSELTFFSKCLESPEKPFLVILGGAKVKDKIQLIMNMIDKVDEMIIGGGMAFTFLKKMYGINLGNSLFDEEGYKTVDQILAKAKEKNVKLHFPVDFLCGDKFDANCNTKLFDLKTGIPDGWQGFDAGVETQKLFGEAVGRAKTIVWNGPVGVFEFEKFKQGSAGLLEQVMKRTAQNATSVIGGGDTVNLVKQTKGADKKLSHVSTGGGASLELLEGKVLPGVNHLSELNEL